MSAPVFPPLEAGGRLYRLTFHAKARAEEMGVPLELIPVIIETGTRHTAPPSSKYAGCYVYRAGKVAVAIHPDPAGDLITTLLWSTVEAWRKADRQAGRDYKGDERTRAALTAWFGKDAA